MNTCFAPGCEGEAASGRWCSKHLNLHAPACPRSKPLAAYGSPCLCPRETFAPDEISVAVADWSKRAEPPAPDDNLPKACKHEKVGFAFGGQEVCTHCRALLSPGTKRQVYSNNEPLWLGSDSPIFTEPPAHQFKGAIAEKPCNNFRRQYSSDGPDYCRCGWAWAEHRGAPHADKTPNTPEPAPKPGTARATWGLVFADMLERDAAGAAKYGIRHQHDNGRDHLVDAYQEALDLALYLRAEIEKRKAGAR